MSYGGRGLRKELAFLSPGQKAETQMLLIPPPQPRDFLGALGRKATLQKTVVPLERPLSEQARRCNDGRPGELSSRAAAATGHATLVQLFWTGHIVMQCH